AIVGNHRLLGVDDGDAVSWRRHDPLRMDEHLQVGGFDLHGSHPRSLNAFRGSRPAFCSFCHSLKNLLFCQRRQLSAAPLLTTSSYSPASIISRATSAPRMMLWHSPHVSPSWSTISSLRAMRSRKSWSLMAPCPARTFASSSEFSAASR